MSKIIDGKEISQFIRNQVKEEVKKLELMGKKITLAVIIVGEDPASKIYVRNKKLACEEVGFISREYALSKDTTQKELLALINELNNDSSVNGILVQLPLPKHLDSDEIIKAIDVKKDVDCFSSENIGNVLIGNTSIAPCTPAGIIEMFKYENIDISGKHCVIVGRSNIVGKPMAMLMLKENATVTICHSKTKNLTEICKQADIIIMAVGKAKMLKGDMVKQGCIVIDVGMNRDENHKLCGDVDFEQVSPFASYITKVPGGVGPMTITMLMKNTLSAYFLQNK